MKCDLVVGGVGGQGILSIAFVLDNAALEMGLHFKQSEVHGMAQRGGAVSTHLRLSELAIHSDLVRLGAADVVLSVEPMEALRYLEYLAPGGVLITSTHPEKNIPDYPPEEALLAELAKHPRAVIFDAYKVAREAGSPRAQNTVMIGALSPFLGFSPDLLARFVAQAFEKKGERLVKVNLDAFRYGRAHGLFADGARRAGADARAIAKLLARTDSATLEGETGEAFGALLKARGPELMAWLDADPERRLTLNAATAAEWQNA